MKPKVLIFGSSTKLAGSELKILEFIRRFDKDKLSVEAVFLYESEIIDKKIQLLDVKVQCFDIKQRGFIRTLAAIKKHLVKEKYDYIYCFGYKVNFIVRLLQLFNNKTRILTAVESTKKDLNILAALFDKITSFKVSKYICVSESAQKVLMDRNKINKEKTVVIKNGIDLDKFNNGKDKSEVIKGLKLNINEDDFVVGCIGNFRKAKGQDILLEACNKLKKYKDIKYVFVGDGELREDYEKLISNYGIEEKVIMLGVREDIQDIIKIFNIMVVPSRWEGFGLVVLEAMASHIPVIASKVDGLLELVKDGFNGMFFENENSEDLSNKILILKDNKFIRDSLADKAYKYTIKPYDVEIMVREIENFILSENR